MQFEFKPSFDRSFKALELYQKQQAKEAIQSLLSFLSKKTELAPGLGLKRLGKSYWEIRSGIRIRILFEISDHVIFYFIGNHDQIRRFIDN